jgi:hypothetical protein
MAEIVLIMSHAVIEGASAESHVFIEVYTLMAPLVLDCFYDDLGCEICAQNCGSFLSVKGRPRN